MDGRGRGRPRFNRARVAAAAKGQVGFLSISQPGTSIVGPVGHFGGQKGIKEYEAYKRKTGMTLIALQPNVPDNAYMSHMKGMYVPFNMAYGSLIYHKRLQSDRPKY